MSFTRFGSVTLHWYAPFAPARDRARELIAALGLVLLAQTLARSGPPLPGLWSFAHLLPIDRLALTALAFVGAIGATAYALARASALPARSAAAQALPALLAGLVLMPGLGALGLAAPLAVAASSGDPASRRLALPLALAILLAWLGERVAPLAWPAALIALGVAWHAWRRDHRIAANDNPSLKRILTLSERTLFLSYARGADGDSDSGKRELRDVQG